MSGGSGDMAAVHDALDALVGVFDGLAEERRRVRRRADHLRRRLAAGATLSEVVTDEERPLIVESVRDATTRVVEAFSRFQRAEAAQLHREGMSMERIATLFGISRQRVASLLERRG